MRAAVAGEAQNACQITQIGCLQTKSFEIARSNSYVQVVEIEQRFDWPADCY